MAHFVLGYTCVLCAVHLPRPMRCFGVKYLGFAAPLNLNLVLV